MCGVRVPVSRLQDEEFVMLRFRDIFLEAPTVELRLWLLTYEQSQQSCFVFGYSSLWHCLQVYWLTLSGSTVEYPIHDVLL